MFTIFAIAVRDGHSRYFTLAFCQRTSHVRRSFRDAPRARARTLSSRDVRREKDYLRCKGVLRVACGKGCAHEGMGKGTASRAPEVRPSRRAIATCATRHAKETRRGET